MSAIPKHEARSKTVRKAHKLAVAEPTAPVTLDVDMSGVEIELGNLAHSLKSYVVNACDGDNRLNLFSGPHDYPVRLVLEGDAVDSIADSLKRIADAMTAGANLELEAEDNGSR